MGSSYTTSTAPSKERANLRPLAGALLLTLVAIGGSIGVVVFQGQEQARYLAAQSGRCTTGTRDACDALRSLCLKREPDGCVALANAHLGAGPSHDAPEAARLLGEACLYRHPAACLRAGRMALEGGEAPKDIGQAKKLLTLGCDIGEREACALRQTIP